LFGGFLLGSFHLFELLRFWQALGHSTKAIASVLPGSVQSLSHIWFGLSGTLHWPNSGHWQCIAAFEACRDGPMPVPKVPPPVGDTCHRSAVQSAATHFSGHGLLRFAEWNRDEPRRATRLHLSNIVCFPSLSRSASCLRISARNVREQGRSSGRRSPPYLGRNA
jgi:hypothetical protein